MAIKKIEDETVLKTTSLKTLRTAVEHKFTAEEKEALRKLTKEDERRAYIIELYKKYIDEVVAEEEGKTTDTGAAGSETEEKKEDKDDVESNDNASTPASKLAELGKTTETTSKEVSTAMSFTLTIRGAAQHNGTVSISCDKLLALVIRNPKAKYIFRSQARANEFIRILKAVSKIKGVANFSEATRSTAIASIKLANGIKA